MTAYCGNKHFAENSFDTAGKPFVTIFCDPQGDVYVLPNGNWVPVEHDDKGCMKPYYASQHFAKTKKQPTP